MLLLSIGAFILGFATDWVWAQWMKHIAAKNAFVAANWSIAVYVAGLLFTLLVVDKLLVPVILYLVGGWLGTYVAVKYGK